MSPVQALSSSLALSGYKTLLSLDQAILDVMPAALYLVSVDGIVVRANRRAQELTGRSELPVGLNQASLFNIFHTDGTALPFETSPMAAALRDGKSAQNIEFLIQGAGHERKSMLVDVEPLWDGNGYIEGSINCFQDITARKRDEVSTTELKRVQTSLLRRAEEQAVLFRFTDKLYRSETLCDIYDAGLDAIVGALRCHRAAILLFDQSNSMRFVASRGLSDRYRQSVDGHSPWQAGETNAQPVFIGDAKADASLAGLMTVIEAEGIGALAFIPLMAKGRVIGKFMAYYDAPHAFEDNEINLAVTIARQLGFSLARLQAEDLIRRNEERLTSMFEHAGVGMTMLEADGTIIQANAAFLALTGRTMDEVIGHGSLEFTHADDVAIHEEAFAQLRGSDEPVRLEKRYVQKNGRDVWARLTLSNGDEGYILAIIEDIDGRKRAEQLLQENADHLALVTDAVPVLIGHCDADCRYKFVNKLYAKRFNMKPDECIGRSVRDVIGADTFEAARKWIDLVLSGQAVDFEAEVTFPALGKRFMQCSYVPEFDSSGAVVGWISAITDITERKLHEDAVEESEERFRAIFETSPECVKLVAPDGTLLQINSAGLTMVEAETPGAVLGSPVYALISPEHRDAFRAFNERICRGERGSLEFQMIGLAGTTRMVETHAAPFRTPAGDTVQLAVTRDITARKKAEEKLRDSQAHLQLTTEAARLGTWQWDIERDEIQWSPLHKQMWGYEPTPDPMPFESWTRCVDPDDLVVAQKAIDDCLAGKGFYDTEYRITPVGRNGEYWIRSTGRATFDSSGKPVLMHGVSMDVTTRKRAEERLRKSEAEFRTLADNIHHLAWMTDATGWIYWYNKRWFDYTGTTLDDMQGWGWRTVQHPEHVDRVVAKLTHCFETGELWEDTFPLRGKDGQYRWFLSRAVPIRNDEGKIVRWFGTNTDITERRQAEEQRTLLINELNHRVKNTLATVQSIAAQTLRGADADPAMRTDLESRLMALSNAHNTLTEESWEGAELRQIVSRALEPHAYPERLRIEGPALRLSPKAAVAIAMAVHELATNAVKYGAFSNETGSVILSWRITPTQPTRLELRWQESGGPPVVPPERQGFGSRLIERSLAHDLEGAAKIDYAAGGVICNVSCPLDAITA